MQVGLDRRLIAVVFALDPLHCIDPHRTNDVLQRWDAQIVKPNRQPAAHIVPDRPGDHDLPGLGSLMDPGSNVDPVSLQQPIVVDHILHIDADPQAQRHMDPALGIAQRSLNVHRPAHRIHRAREFDQQCVARDLSHPAALLPDMRFQQVYAQLPPALQGVGLVRRHEP